LFLALVPLDDAHFGVLPRLGGIMMTLAVIVVVAGGARVGVEWFDWLVGLG